ncbi:class I SAM-dependent DNA methyltransferase [Emticicia sp. SJ17W-69]|uniref:class I SAM-dependent DNA methyltransferase n=1 Tax=Emticicia sp. SJ17W-69 TaxID=3421657 RepID=UPI003EB9EAF2
MSKLYTSLAKVYHEIYQTLFNYDDEFAFYETYLQAHQIKSIVEIGCGTGNLAKRLVDANYEYLGIDLFQEMLDIATRNAPNASFTQGDVRNFSLPSTSDCFLITGRSISYLTTTYDILQSMDCIYKNLKPNGILMFDAIDAAQLFLDFKELKKDELIASFGENYYKRNSESKPNLKTGWTWDWSSVYYQLDSNQTYQEIGQDFSTLRAFTKDEVRLLLNMSGFELLEILPKKSYAWDDNFFIAKKI